MALLPKHTMIHPSFLTLTPILAKRYPFPPTIYQRGSSRRSCWQNANTRPRSLLSTLTRTSDFSLHCAVASGAPPIMGRASASAKTFRCPIRCRERDRAAGPSLTSPGPLASDYKQRGRLFPVIGGRTSPLWLDGAVQWGLPPAEDCAIITTTITTTNHAGLVLIHPCSTLRRHPRLPVVLISR